VELHALNQTPLVPDPHDDTIVTARHNIESGDIDCHGSSLYGWTTITTT